MTFVLRLVSSGTGRAGVRDTEYATKAEVLGAIEKLGKLSSIRRLNVPTGRIYVVTPKGK